MAVLAIPVAFAIAAGAADVAVVGLAAATVAGVASAAMVGMSVGMMIANAMFPVTTTTTSTMSVNGLGDRCGCMISPNAVRTIHSAAPSNIAATMAEAMGSALPWP